MKGGVAPFQGLGVIPRRVPRALPWAGLFQPLRGEESVSRRPPQRHGPESVCRLLQFRRARKPDEPHFSAIFAGNETSPERDCRFGSSRACLLTDSMAGASPNLLKSFDLRSVFLDSFPLAWPLLSLFGASNKVGAVKICPAGFRMLNCGSRGPRGQNGDFPSWVA
jgi:hypothetical protein